MRSRPVQSLDWAGFFIMMLTKTCSIRFRSGNDVWYDIYDYKQGSIVIDITNKTIGYDNCGYVGPNSKHVYTVKQIQKIVVRYQMAGYKWMSKDNQRAFEIEICEA